MNEADTRARLIDPKLKQSGWTDTQITREQQPSTVVYLDGAKEPAFRLAPRGRETDAELKRLERSILDRAFRGEL